MRTGSAPELTESCPICGRPMVPGSSVDRHHWVPRAYGGREWGWMHQICHRKIHALFSESDLARRYSTASEILSHPEMEKFVAWVKRRPPEYNDWHKRPRRRR
ncbi:HNH endonuclease [Nisaea acidiphila]|uniref:HNH endonuclease n=1 Tax=Nisaea acidiphila TaxID=1862145 RepID=A0A9J7ANF6_9PROT|nr:HNH endonuclease [Nisaea acidiphila]UUX48121.1 HNH endonuclease [Nisaea acidiphila]